jgi:hypothetical protein
MSDSDGGAIVPRKQPVDLEDLGKDAIAAGDRKAALGKEISKRAVEKALGDEASDEVKKALSVQLAPWAERLVTILDDWLRIPGTDIKIGLDPILGLIPGIGDLVSGGSSAALLLLALKERVPTIAILRMVINIGIDTVVGSIPIVGDAFDFVYRANRQNLDLIKRYKADPKAEPTRTDKMLVGVGFALIGLGILIPFTVGAALAAWLSALLHAG